MADLDCADALTKGRTDLHAQARDRGSLNTIFGAR